MMATVFFLHLTCFDTRQRSTATAATTKKKKKPKVLAENVHQSAGVRCGAARPGEPCESGNCSCPKTGVGTEGGEWARRGGFFFFWKHTTIHHVARRNEPLGNAALALSRRRQRWLCLCFTLVLLLFLLLLLLAWLVVASVCCCFSY